jgi:hypothetical protein
MIPSAKARARAKAPLSDERWRERFRDIPRATYYAGDYDVRRATSIADWYKDHVATAWRYTSPDAEPIEVLRWAKPGTFAYRVDYLLQSGHLFVSGDLGSATFATYSGATLHWWARCDLDYFASKCEASERGRFFKDWDSDLARRHVRSYLVDRDADEGAVPRETDDEDAYWGREPTTTRGRFAKTGGWRALGDDQHEWIEWLREHGSEVGGSDWWDSGLASAGEVISVRCHGMLAGLKMAVRQISAGESA